MKAASSALISLLGSTSSFLMADCYTITLRDASVLRYTSRDRAVTVGSHVFAAGGPLISGLKYKITATPDVDEQEVTIAAKATDLVGGVPFLVALQRGVFDGAYIQRERAFFSSWTSAAVGSVILFYGRISTIDNIGRTSATVKVKTELVVLADPMPRNIYQAACLHTFGDSGCGIDKSAWTVTGAAQAGSTNAVVVWSGETGYGAQHFDQGTLIFTSGTNAGTEVTVKTTDGSGNMTLMNPLDVAPGVGDAFSICAGCDHSLGSNGCAKFSNQARFRGFPYTPPPEAAY